MSVPLTLWLVLTVAHFIIKLSLHPCSSSSTFSLSCLECSQLCIEAMYGSRRSCNGGINEGTTLKQLCTVVDALGLERSIGARILMRLQQAGMVNAATHLDTHTCMSQ